MNVRIDNEFRTLIPPLTKEEFDQLEANCIENGIQDSLKTWNGILVDGHNRYEIADKHGLEFKTEEMEFSGRDDVKLWIIKNQLGRRNLDKWQRFDLAKQQEHIEKARAKKVQMSNLVQNKYTEPENLPPRKQGDTRDIMGERVGVSGKTYDKMKAIDESDNEEVKRKVRNKEMSIDKAYREVKGFPPKKKPQPQTEVREVEVTVANEDVMKNPIRVEEVKVEADIINKPVEEEPLPFEETTEDVSEDLASTFEVFDATPVAELGRAIEILLDLKENCDSLIEGIKKAKTGSEKEAFKKQLTDCGKLLAHIENGLIGW